MAFAASRDFHMSDPYDRALSYEVNSPDALVLATAEYPSSANSTKQRAYLLVVPQSEGPLLVAATVWSGHEDKPYFDVRELGPVSVMTRRRFPGDLQRPLDLDRAEGRSFADAVGGGQAYELWYSGLGADAVSLIRTVDPGSDDPVTLSFVAQWMEDGSYVSEVLASGSATALRDKVEYEFSFAMKAE